VPLTPDQYRLAVAGGLGTVFAVALSAWFIVTVSRPTGIVALGRDGQSNTLFIIDYRRSTGESVQDSYTFRLRSLDVETGAIQSSSTIAETDYPPNDQFRGTPVSCIGFDQGRLLLLNAKGFGLELRDGRSGALLTTQAALEQRAGIGKWTVERYVGDKLVVRTEFNDRFALDLTTLAASRLAGNNDLPADSPKPIGRGREIERLFSPYAQSRDIKCEGSQCQMIETGTNQAPKAIAGAETLLVARLVAQLANRSALVSHLVALDHSTRRLSLVDASGRRVWSNADVTHQYPEVYDLGSCFLVNQDTGLVMLDAAGGETKWRAPLPEALKGEANFKMLLSYPPRIIIARGVRIVAIEESSGQVAWTAP
jgi:hypothetical protein